MKKLSLLIALCFSVFTMAQEKQFLEVNYQMEMDMELEEVMKNVPSQYRAMVEDQIKQELEDGVFLDYVLKTNGNESSYKMVDQITNAQDQGGMIAQQMKQFDKGVLYKNIEANEYRKPVEVPGTQYLIQDTLTDFHWTVTREKENIAGFETRKANGYFVYQNDTINAVAWFAPKIAIKDGPSNLWGLPGLILKSEFKMNGADVTVLAKKVMVKEEEIKIEKPEDGKVVTQSEFEAEIKALQEKYKAMMQEGVDTE
ncbi:GLPGLI family protein [Flavobacteriaceae bacterium Ap0902]|nr:GLPGLI family protein [Flavobacteriaceae bacterium Ap0902]